MSVLCQIALVDDEKEFMNLLKEHGFPSSSRGWGRFTGEVPAIGSTLEINWCDYESVNNILHTESDRIDKDRQSDYFRVIHHHRHFVPTPEYYDRSDDATKYTLEVGCYSIYVCMVYVVRTRIID
jgi:hypothetical protein